MTIKELQKSIDNLIPVLQKQIDTYDTLETIEGRDVLQQKIGQLWMLKQIKNQITK